ncbi:MAG: DUF885 domain-containing protein [Gammaproteobacteria bacterium]|nr:DUF885 domain-containing protein [Gammaproteobacteria bacterium]
MAVIAVILAGASLAGRAAQPTEEAAEQWNVFVQSFIDGYFGLNPTFAVVQGRHEYDGRLPDWSPAGLAAAKNWLHGQRDRAAAFDASGLDEARRFERDYLIAVADRELFWLESSRFPYTNPQFYSGALDPDVYVVRPYAPLKDRMRAYTGYANAIPGAVEQIRANLKPPLPATYVNIGHIAFGGFASFFETDVPGIFASVDDRKLQAEFKQANDAAIAALKSLDEWFLSQKASATNDFALGAELYKEMLWKTERVEVPLEQLRQIGERDLDRNIAAMREACAALAPGVPIPDCVKRVDVEKPKDSPVLEARRQLEQLKAFLTGKKLVSIPGPEEAQVNESPPYQRYNSAYISIPGPYENNMPSVYYIAPPDPAWTKEEQQAYIPGTAMLMYTSVHEVWPGHFLQFLHANRSPSKFGQVFVGYAFAEGWAHYSEEMMWDAGLGKGDPKSRIGQLNQALLRNVRFLSSIGMHTAGMTVEQSEQMFREKAFQDAGTSRQQAARGTFDPAYLNYTMGKLMIRKLREDWTASRGGREAWQAFHDKFLSFGGPPIPLVRKAMLGHKAGPLF